MVDSVHLLFDFRPPLNSYPPNRPLRRCRTAAKHVAAKARRFISYCSHENHMDRFATRDKPRRPNLGSPRHFTAIGVRFRHDGFRCGLLCVRRQNPCTDKEQKDSAVCNVGDPNRKNTMLKNYVRRDIIQRICTYNSVLFL